MNRNFKKAAQKPCRIDTVVIPIAGKGTRLLPTTKAIPKHFQTVGGIPLIQYAVEEAKRACIKKFVFIIDTDPLNKALIEKHFLPQAGLEEHLRAKGMTDTLEQIERLELQPEQIAFVVQKKQTGLWNAVKSARSEIVGDTFAVITPDDLILPAMAGLPDLARHHRAGGATISVEQVPQKDISKFGIVKYGDVGKDGVFSVEDVVEKPALKDAPSDMAIAGRYILPTSLFDRYVPDRAATVKQEISIAHALQAVAHDIPVGAVLIPGKKYDGGSKQGLALANIALYAEDPELAPALQHAVSKSRKRELARQGLHVVGA